MKNKERYDFDTAEYNELYVHESFVDKIIKEIKKDEERQAQNMNDYQKAYQRLTSRVYKYDHIEDVYKDLEILGELVERATPKKLIDESFADKLCSICGAYINFDALNDRVEHAPKYCSECGQKLDWGERREDEETER